MATLEEKLDKVLKDLSSTQVGLAPAVHYAKTGDQKYLKQIDPKNVWGISFMVQPLVTESELTETGRRVLDVFALASEGSFGEWAHLWCVAGDGITRFNIVLAEANRVGMPLGNILKSFAKDHELANWKTSWPWVQKLMEFKDAAALMELLVKTRQQGVITAAAELRPRELIQLLESLIKKEEAEKLYPSMWVAAARSLGKKGVELADRAMKQLPEDDRFSILSELAEFAPEYKKPAMDAAKLVVLSKEEDGSYELWYSSHQAALWLLRSGEQSSLGVLTEYFGAPIDNDKWRRNGQTEYKAEVLKEAAEKLGRKAIPCFAACFKTPQPELQIKALQYWIPLSEPGDAKALEQHFRALLASEDGATVARAARLAGDWNLSVLEDAIWPLFASKSRPTRDAAGVVLAKLGDARLDRAKEFWKAKKADTRIAAANWLKAVGTPKAAEVVKARLEEEEDEDVRDALLMALEKITGSAGGDIDEITGRIRSTLKKVGKSPVPWLDPKKLPQAKLSNGEKLSSEWLSYLLYRQSRVKEMRADLEAKPLYGLIDRKTSGDLALAVLNSFLGTKMNADDRWTLAFAAVVGDDRLVPALRRQIDEWADSMRGKLAEYGVQALALLGTDTALLTVDAMAIRYRSKNKNIGKAASEAFAAAAEARGLTVEELGDLVVPWLGFEPGKPRIIETPKTKIEARIGSDFKLVLQDAATKKKVAKLPDNAPAEIKAEFKEIGVALKEAVKSQLLRLETLMVRQFRWPAARWAELFLHHPLLFPFAQRLVWGFYDSKGKLVKTFRALEDRSLTDNADETCELPKSGTVGIVHPLELTEADRQQWVTHLADYEIEPPFSQLDRSVVRVKPEHKELKFGKEVEGTDLNALTFRGRAEKLGWSRGSVADAGSVNFYVKRFPNSGVDVFLALDGLYMGAGMDDEVTLGKVCFVKSGTVKVGSYEYDEPADDKDERLVPFGQVPEIPFSESMGDLAKIAAKSQPSEGA